jgi:hypothetical protein
MTAIWGPLGWMTLHSVATSYPELPTLAEKQLLSSWLDMFRDTITCVHCREHFTDMLKSYRSQFPGYLNSRHDFAMFTFRAHNTVNRRLSKPVYTTVEECLETLRNNTKTRSAKDYRISYVNHITKYWRTFQDVAGIVALKKINEMRKIEVDYFQPRDTHFDVTFANDVVLLPRDMLEKNGQPTERTVQQIQTIRTKGLVFGAGGFRIRR